MTIPEWAAVAVLAILSAVIGWGFKRVIEGQDKLVSEVSGMNVSIAETCGRIAMTNQTQQEHKNLCDERHELNVGEHEKVWDVIEKIRQ